MAETSKNKIYYNNDENSVADVLADMKKMAESTDKAIENSKYDDTQIKKDISNMKTEITVKDNEQDSKILQLQTEKAKLEKELKEMQEDIYQASIRGQASGEYIHVEDSSNCRCKIGIGGNQEQETRSGKNKIEITKTTTTVNGCTHTIKDGTDTLSGTSTGWANLIIYSFTGDGETYTLSGSPTSSKNIFISARDNTQNKDLATSKNGSTGTFVATSGNPIDIIICVASNITLTNELFKPQLELGSNATEWEQGGAMPSQNHQSKIKTVGSNVNLANLGEKAQYTSSGFTVSWKDSVFKMSGTASTNLTIPANVTGVTNAINLGNFKAGTYTVSRKILNGNMVNTKGSGIYLRSSNGMIASIYIASIKDRASFTLTEDTNIYIYVFIDSGTQYSDLEIGIKIVEGTEVGEYSKYGQGCINEVICNKNLFNVSILNDYSQNGLTLIKNKGTNKIKLNGTPSADFTIYSKDFDINKLKIGSTYSLSKDFDNITFNFEVFENNSNTASVWKKSITMQKSYTRVRVYVQGKANTTFNNQEIALQLEKGNATEIVAHQSQTYIIPTQQEMLEGDYFDFDNEEEVHTWNKLVLNGTESIEKFQYSDNTFLIAKGAKNVNASEILVKSNMFMGVSYNNRTISRNYIIYVEIETGNIIFRNTSYSALADFKTWLKSQYDAGTPVTVYYKLATPTRLAFTDDQKAVAKELNNARTYKNVTNITTDSIAILDLDYAKDLEELTEYSTEERVIGRWIDGKPLYSKVGSIKFTSVYDSSGLHTRGSLIDSDIDYGTVSKVLNKNLLSSSLFNTYGTSTSNVYVENRQGNSNKGYILGFTDRTDLLNTTIYVVVEYTKTTD